MTRLLIGAVLACLWCSFGAWAQGVVCREASCRDTLFLLTSTSDQRAYGMLMTLPLDAPCVAARMVVLDMDNRRLGESELLVPGEQGRVRLGRGFAQGVHPVRLVVSGCDTQPQQVRRIMLNKASPDHGSRAVMVEVGA